MFGVQDSEALRPSESVVFHEPEWRQIRGTFESGQK